MFSCVCDYAGSENNEEQYECVPGQPHGYIDVPPYSSSDAGTVTEDWEKGMILLSFLVTLLDIKVSNSFQRM